MPCPFTPLLPLLASLPFIAVLRKRFGVTRERKAHTALDLPQELLREGSNQGLRWESNSGTSCSVHLHCSLPIPERARWDIFPDGAPAFVVKRANQVVNGISNAQAVLFGKPVLSAATLNEDIPQRLMAVPDRGLISLLRVASNGLHVRFKEFKMAAEDLEQILRDLQLVCQELSGQVAE
jgi:hypothetical protein